MILHLNREIIINNLCRRYYCEICGKELVVDSNPQYYEGKSGTTFILSNGGVDFITDDILEYDQPTARKDFISCGVLPFNGI